MTWRSKGDLTVVNGKRSPAILVADMVIGVLMIVVALILHLVIPGIPFALLVLGGVLLIVTGILYR
jgi:hypothetical protein